MISLFTYFKLIYYSDNRCVNRTGIDFNGNPCATSLHDENLFADSGPHGIHRNQRSPQWRQGVWIQWLDDLDFASHQALMFPRCDDSSYDVSDQHPAPPL
jgi:hypothetical protein